MFPIEILRFLVCLNYCINRCNRRSVSSYICSVRQKSCSCYRLIKNQWKKSISGMVLKVSGSLTSCVAHINLLTERKNKILLRVACVHLSSCGKRDSSIWINDIIRFQILHRVLTWLKFSRRPQVTCFTLSSLRLPKYHVGVTHVGPKTNRKIVVIGHCRNKCKRLEIWIKTDREVWIPELVKDVVTRYGQWCDGGRH